MTCVTRMEGLFSKIVPYNSLKEIGLGREKEGEVPLFSSRIRSAGQKGRALNPDSEVDVCTVLSLIS